MNISTKREKNELYSDYRERIKNISEWTKRRRKGEMVHISVELIQQPVLNPKTMLPIKNAFQTVKRKVEGTFRNANGVSQSKIDCMQRRLKKQLKRSKNI